MHMNAVLNSLSSGAHMSHGNANGRHTPQEALLYLSSIATLLRVQVSDNYCCTPGTRTHEVYLLDMLTAHAFRRYFAAILAMPCSCCCSLP